jgi:hypothetical protein
VKRCLVVTAFLCVALSWAAEPSLIRWADLPSPTASRQASAPSVAVGPDGWVWMTWLEREGATTALKFATLNRAAKTWSAASTIASGPNWFVNWADFPALTVGAGGRATAVWYVNNPSSAGASSTADHHGPGYHARISESRDGGKTWSAAAPLTRESDSVEFVSLATLADGRVLAAWLDGRGHKTTGATQRLYARILGTPGEDVLVDASVCDCCQTALTAFPDGTALLAYRARRDGEIRDIHVRRFQAGAWSESRPLADDNWKISGCPVNGPQLASDGGRVAAAWFTGADDNPRVLASFSSDAGSRFLLPLRLGERQPVGRVSTALLHNTTFLVTYLDRDSGLWLQRVSPDFVPTTALQLHDAAAKGRVQGFPRAVVITDYAGGTSPAEIVVTFTAQNAPGIRSMVVTVPEHELLEAERNCDCGPAAGELQGYAVRGTIISSDRATDAVQVRLYEVPGVFPAGVYDFKVAPAVFPTRAQPNQAFLGRAEKRDGRWWLIDLRLIAMPK